MEKSVGEKVKQLELSYAVGGNAKQCHHFQKNGLAISYKVKYTLTIWFTNPISRHLPVRNESYVQHKELYLDVHRSFVHNSPQLDTTQMFISSSKDKLSVISPHNGMLLHNKRE